MQPSIIETIWYAPMHTIYTFFIGLTGFMLAYYGWQYLKQKWRGSQRSEAGRPAERSTSTGLGVGSSRTAAIGDPSVAGAAMMYAVAIEDGPLTKTEERLILRLLETVIGLGPDAASAALARGRRLADGVSGDLTTRLHRLKGPIEDACTPPQKEDLIEMLNEVAGGSVESLRSVREGLGRIAVTLREG